MKTAVEIPDVLFREAKELARQRNWTIQMVLEESLCAYLHVAASQRQKETLAHATFGSPEGSSTTLAWPEIRDMVYRIPSVES